MTLDELKAEVVKAGYRVSAGCWEDEHSAYAFSVETCGPGFYGHSKFTAGYCKVTGWVTIGSRAYKAVQP